MSTNDTIARRIPSIPMMMDPDRNDVQPQHDRKQAILFYFISNLQQIQYRYYVGLFIPFP